MNELVSKSEDNSQVAIKFANSIYEGESGNYSIRKFSNDGKEWMFCAADVAKVLDYSDANMMVKSHCLSEAIKSKCQGQLLLFISEGDLYNLILRSNKPEAIPFRKWITHEVIPSVHKTGKYIRRSELLEKLYKDFETTPPEQSAAPIAEPAVSFKSTLNYALPKPLVGEMIEARKRLLEKGKEFPTDKDFLAYMLNKAMVSMGFLPPEDDDA